MELKDNQVKETDSEKELLEGFRSGDKNCTEKIYREHFGMIKSLITNNKGSAEDAADVFQETMVVLFERLQAGDFELNCKLKTYLYSVSRNIWLKKLQKKRHYVPDTENLAETVPVEDDIQKHEQEQRHFNLMEMALGRIGEPCRSLLNSYYILKKPMQQIAEEFGYTNADNAKTQKYKCLVRLKKIFFTDFKNI